MASAFGKALASSAQFLLIVETGGGPPLSWMHALLRKIEQLAGIKARKHRPLTPTQP